jgi:hypothetical protein
MRLFSTSTIERYVGNDDRREVSVKVDAETMTACRSCGQSDSGFEVVSEHRTAGGVVSYVRCDCGTLQIMSRSRLDSSERVLVGTRPLPSVGAGTSVA